MTRRMDSVLFVLLVMSLIGNVYLYRGHAAPVPPTLHPGDKVVPIQGKTLDGKTVSIGFEARPVVLYIFSPSCSWCERNLDNARALSSLVHKEFDFVAISVDDKNLDEYLKERTLLSWRVVKDVSIESRRLYRIGPTPVTIVVGVGGRVLHVWPGAYLGNTLREVERTF